MRLSQTSIIAASLMVAYIIFITVRGELPMYLAVFTGKVSRTGTPVATAKPAGDFSFTVPGAPTINVGGPTAPERPEEFPGYNPGFNFWDLNDPSNPFFKGF